METNDEDDKKINEMKESLRKSLASYEKKISLIRRMTEGITTSNVRGLVISGTPGIGKSFNVLSKLDELKGPNKLQVLISKGHVTPYQVYKMMHDHSGPECILVFDDCDDVLDNTQSLNLLKAATEYAKHRYVTWNSTLNGSTNLNDKFEFKGKIIILTNKRLNDNPHYGAFIDRVHYFDMKCTFEEKLAKIMTIAKDICNVITPNDDCHDIIRYLIDNKNRINQDRFSIRNFIKLAEMKALFGDGWEDCVDTLENVIEYNN